MPFNAAFKLFNWYPLLTLPLFIYMGYILSESGIADDLYRTQEAHAANLSHMRVLAESRGQGCLQLVAHFFRAADQVFLDQNGQHFGCSSAGRRMGAERGEQAAVAIYARLNDKPLAFNRCIAGKFSEAHPSGQCISARSWSVMIIRMLGCLGILFEVIFLAMSR